LTAAGAVVCAYEPFKVDAQAPGVAIVPSLEEALESADLILLLVAHTPLVNLTPQEVSALTPARTIADAVNGFPAAAWEAAGFLVFRLGVGSGRKDRSVRDGTG